MLDSFGSRTLRDIAEMARLRGAVTIILGIQPDVAFAIGGTRNGHRIGNNGGLSSRTSTSLALLASP